MKNHTRSTEKNPENPRSNFYAIGLHFGKNPTFPGKKTTFPEKSVFSPPKFLMTLFKSSTLILKFSPFIHQKLKKTSTDSLLFQQETLVFQQKTLENMYFPGRF